MALLLLPCSCCLGVAGRLLRSGGVPGLLAGSVFVWRDWLDRGNGEGLLAKSTHLPEALFDAKHVRAVVRGILLGVLAVVILIEFVVIVLLCWRDDGFR